MSNPALGKLKTYLSPDSIKEIESDLKDGQAVEYVATTHGCWPSMVKRIKEGTYANHKRLPRIKNGEMPSLKSIMEAIFEKKRGRIKELEDHIEELKKELSDLESDADYQAAKMYLAAQTRKIATNA